MYLTPKEVAGRFKISERQATHLARSGYLPAIKIGRLWRFSKEEIENWERNQGIDKDEIESLTKEIIGTL